MYLHQAGLWLSFPLPIEIKKKLKKTAVGWTTFIFSIWYMIIKTPLIENLQRRRVGTYSFLNKTISAYLYKINVGYISSISALSVNSLIAILKKWTHNVSLLWMVCSFHFFFPNTNTTYLHWNCKLTDRHSFKVSFVIKNNVINPFNCQQYVYSKSEERLSLKKGF